MRTLLKDDAIDQNALKWLESQTSLYLDRKIKYMRTIKNLGSVWGYIPSSKIIAKSDARTLVDVRDQSVDSIITSPPYANAQEYLRSIKLELYWLGLLNQHNLKEISSQIVGTEKIPLSTCKETPLFGIENLDKALSKIHAVDNKRAHIICRYFKDMEASIKQCYRTLKPGGYFGLLVGNNVIRKTPIDTHIYIQEIAAKAGFITETIGYDRIVARKLTPKRNKSAGIIEVEWMLIFRKPAL
tara:strand:- start:204 stop:929 length:726 start_codon:yes stop_codon:yes gene_type:complete